MVLTGALGALAAVILVVVVQVVLAGTSATTVERVLAERAESVARAAGVSSTQEALTVPDARLDPGVAVYDADAALVAGQAPGRFADVFASLSGVEGPVSRDISDSYRALGLPFTTPAGVRGVVVVVEPLAPYENDERDALVVSVIAGVLIFLLTTGLAAWVTKRALAPVAQMAHTAQEWSEHDLERRFGLGAPDNEIRALGHTLDGLLDKVARAILAEQRLTAELAHELRTPLTAALGTADLVLMREGLDSEVRQDVAAIAASCRVMSDIVTSLLDLARTQASLDTTLVATRSSVADGVMVAVAAHPGGAAVELDVPQGLATSVPLDLVGRIVAPLLDNGLRIAEHVSVRAGVEDRWVQILVSDDGPGLPVEVADVVFEPGSSTGGGSGLGLALARRVARSVGGEVEALSPVASLAGVPDDPRFPGARFVVRLPLAARG